MVKLLRLNDDENVQIFFWTNKNSIKMKVIDWKRVNFRDSSEEPQFLHSLPKEQRASICFCTIIQTWCWFGPGAALDPGLILRSGLADFFVEQNSFEVRDQPFAQTNDLRQMNSEPRTNSVPTAALCQRKKKLGEMKNKPQTELQTPLESTDLCQAS